MIQNNDKIPRKRLKFPENHDKLGQEIQTVSDNIIVPAQREIKSYRKALATPIDITPDTEYPESISNITGKGLHWGPMYEELKNLIETLQPLEDKKAENAWNTAPIFNLTRVALMGRLFASPEDIAGALACEVKAIQRELKNPESPFSLVYNMAKSQTALALRKEQLSVAFTGDSAMLKWTGIQNLGQSDKLETRSTIVDERSPEEREARIHELMEIKKKIASA